MLRMARSILESSLSRNKVDLYLFRKKGLGTSCSRMRMRENGKAVDEDVWVKVAINITWEGKFFQPLGKK